MKRILFAAVIALNSVLIFSQGMGNEMYQLSQLRNNVKSRQVSSL